MLHILTGATCNNHCVFCMEWDREARRVHNSSQTRSDIHRFIEQYPKRDEILFTSGEPTLNQDLDQYVDWAREAGYRTIGMITNGRRLAMPKYAKAMVARGVNKFTISIHGHDAGVHDELVRSKRAFDQTLKGIKNLATIRKRTRHRFDIHTSTVVVKANLPHLAEIHAMLRRLDVDRMCFNVMMVKGGGRENYEWLGAHYDDVVAAFREITEGLPRRELLKIAVQDVPRCATVGLPDEVLHLQENYDQFEPTNSLGIDDADLGLQPGGVPAREIGGDPALLLPDGSPSVPLQRLLDRASDKQLSGDADYYVTTRNAKEVDVLRVKRDRCAECSFEQSCPGVWRGYIEAHGWSRLEPITDPGTQPEKTGLDRLQNLT